MKVRIGKKLKKLIEESSEGDVLIYDERVPLVENITMTQFGKRFREVRLVKK